MQKNLTPGDTIAFIAPSSLPEGDFAPTVEGFKVKIFPSCTRHSNDDERVKDLHDAFSDPEIKAIICARGGYGALRILDKIDYNIICANPKIFAGSSDITLLLLMFYSKCGLVTYHSKMGCLPEAPSSKILPKKDVLTLNKGSAKGVLWGGNLATIVSLFGSAGYLPKDNIILFLEDINEPIYKIDRMLTQIFRNSELKNKIKGIIYGEFTGADEEELKTLLTQFAPVPAFYGYNISHGTNNQTLPVGAEAELLENGTICLT